MRAALFVMCAVSALAVSCGKAPTSDEHTDVECTKQTDCANDQSKTCASGTCVEVGSMPSMEIRLSKAASLSNKSIQSLRLASIQTLTPNGRKAVCTTRVIYDMYDTEVVPSAEEQRALGVQVVTSFQAASDPALFNMVFEKSFPLATGDIYKTGAPMNDDTGVIFAEVFDVPQSQQKEAGTKPIGKGCWDRSKEQIYECPAGSGNKCITFVLYEVVN